MVHILGSLTLLSLFLAATGADGPKEAPRPACCAELCTAVVAAANGKTCRVIALADLGTDPELASWIAHAIPVMVAPGSWCSSGEKGSLSYFAPARIIVVNHTPAVHAEIDALLQKIRQSLPAHARTAPTPLVNVMPASQQMIMPPMAPIPSVNVIPASHQIMTPARLTESAVKSVQESKRPDAAGPRHVFQISIDGLELKQGESEGFKLKNFTIRYEGEGIIDSNIVALLKNGLPGMLVQNFSDMPEVAGGGLPMIGLPTGMAGTLPPGAVIGWQPTPPTPVTLPPMASGPGGLPPAAFGPVVQPAAATVPSLPPPAWSSSGPAPAKSKK